MKWYDVTKKRPPHNGMDVLVDDLKTKLLYIGVMRIRFLGSDYCFYNGTTGQETYFCTMKPNELFWTEIKGRKSWK